MSGARFRTNSGGVAASPRQDAEGSIGPDGAIACSQISFAAVWALARLSDAASGLFTEPLAEVSTFDLGKSCALLSSSVAGLVGEYKPPSTLDSFCNAGGPSLSSPADERSHSWLAFVWSSFLQMRHT